MPRSCTSNRMPMRLFGTALAALTIAVCAPDEARAGCSHEGTALPRLHDRLVLLEAAHALGTIVDPDDAPEVGPPRKDRPGSCTGPSCSGRSGLPTIPPSVTAPRFTEWAAITPTLHDGGPALEVLLAGGLMRWTNPLVDPIFHPPRPAGIAR